MTMRKYNSYYNISPKEFYNYNGSQLETLRSAYACKLANRAGAQNMSVRSMREILSTAFGNDWHLQPYNKLFKLAKSASCKTKEPYTHIMPKNDSVFARNYAEDLIDSSFARIAEKFYGKRAVEEFLHTEVCKTNMELKITATKLMYAIKIAKLYASYDRKDLRKLRKLTGSQLEIVQAYARAYTGKLSKKEHGVMPEHILKELMQDELEILLLKTIKDKNWRNNAYSGMRENILGKIWDAAWRTALHDTYTDNYISKMCDSYDTYKRIKELEVMTQSLGVRPYNNSCCHLCSKNKLCNKTYQAVKRIYDTDLDESVKRASIEQITRALHVAHSTNRVWAPHFVSIEGNN